MACTCKPGKVLCRSCLNKTSTPYVGNAVNGNGEYTTHQIDVFQKQFENTIAADVQQNPLTAAVSKHGSKSFYNSVTEINSDFLERNFIVEKLPEYKVLHKRLEYGKITALEFATFMRNSNYTPSTVLVSANANGPRFLNELDDYYNGDFADSVLGGFCSLFDNIFDAIDGFFSIIGSLNDNIQDALTFIAKIKNIKDPLQAVFDAIKVKALIESIKTMITETIKKTITAVCMSISNFNVEAITGPVTSPIQTNIIGKMEAKKTALQTICGKEEAKKIVDKINALIDYAVGLFSNPSIEEIMFLISRICALATGIEGVIKGLKDPLDDFANRYDEVFNTIRNSSARITGEAIRAGAIRSSEENRQKQINNAKEVWEKAGNIKLSTPQEYRDLPSWSKLESGTDTRIKIQGDWVTNMTPAREGWEMLDTDLRVLIMRLQVAAKEADITQNHLYLNSGYRNPIYNAKVDGTKSSQHLSGLAVDLTWDGFRGRSIEVDRFIILARKMGFRGIGLYDRFIHVDVGPERQWDKRS